MLAGGGSDMLLVACIVLGIVALTAVVGVFSQRRKTRTAARLARARARTLSELLRTIRMAESIADLGIWQFDPATGGQFWSEGMRAIFGIEHDDLFVAGDAETVLFANDIDLVASVMLHRDETETFDLRFDITDFQDQARSISVQACNLRSASGGVDRVIAVVRDVTDQVTRERELQASRALALSEAERARELASTDPLTGLANRRRVMAELDRMLMRARHSKAPLTLVVFDIDHFKSINDTYGHPQGDAVLRRVAEIALVQARETDLVGRVGGEEFIWIVPRTDEESAHSLADRLRRAIALGSSVGNVPGVTVSVGCAEMAAGDTALSLFARADDALYQAKNSGRNQVRLAA